MGYIKLERSEIVRYNNSMFKFLIHNIYSTEPRSFGLDISDNSFKFAELKSSSKSIELSSFGSGMIDPGIIEGGEIKNIEALTQALKSGIEKPQKGKISTKYVVCSLPEEHSFVRVLQIPNMSPEETAEAIRPEIEQNIPLSIDEVYFDWQIISKPEDKLDHQDVLIYAMPKNIVDPYVETLRKVGLFPIAMESESISVTRSIIEGFKTDYPILVIDMGATISSFIIFAGNTLKFSASSPIAGKKMMEGISKKLGVDEKEARRLFYEIGFDKSLDKDGKVTEALEPFFDDIISQISNYISFYNDHPEHDHNLKSTTIQKIVLSGGVSNLYGLPAHLAAQLKIPVELANPWVNILKKPLKEIPDLSFKRSLGYTTVLGLALRNLNNKK